MITRGFGVAGGSDLGRDLDFGSLCRIGYPNPRRHDVLPFVRYVPFFVLKNLPKHHFSVLESPVVPWIVGVNIDRVP